MVEHHFLYNWVNDARTLELNGELTPAGEMFGNFKSEVGFKKTNEYNHQWKVAPGWLSSNISSDYQSTTLTWYDHNGETGKSYIIERKANLEEEFTIVGTVNMNNDYEIGGTVTFNDPINYKSATYRIKAVSYKDTESAYSHEANITIDQVADAPQLNAEALSAGIVQLPWNDAQGALTYNIYRANNSEGPFELIEEQFNYTPKNGEAETINIYKDENLSEATSYYYYVTSLNSNPQSAASETIPVTTPTINSPMAVENLYISSGDNTVVLSWGFAYDVHYNIYRSTSENGTYTAIASNHSGTFYKDINSLNNNETYFYKVEATNTKGTGPLSVALSATPKNGQHALFNFNENNGTVAFDQWGGYHAELKNNSQWTTAPNGYAIALSESNQSYVELGDNIVSSLTDFTIATWVKLSENTTWNRIFDFGNGTNKYMFLTSKSSGNTVRFGIKNNGDEVQINGNLTMNKDEWYHITITQNGLEGVLYINGVAVGTNTNMTINPSDLGSTSQNYLGKSQWSTDPYCNHKYDDFRIYNYALNENDVLKLTNNKNLSNSKVNLFDAFLNTNPNPIERGQDLKITLESTVEKATATLYNLAGSVITKQQIKAGINRMTTPKNSGIYILEIRTNNASVNRKIIVQ
ncbi:LamG-like jellyroll fold domain-containing protein [Wenyingzhuangia sp. chi5]|uniref:LamG-like jellyroll fold domain-containing protein n=1 Tax=Wenyingzhuangia gilva TaxID=3057677 RepID=A0ABT8VTQ8_9FLAO|nr:LamG-like jellyroll fold domain-containing protein [Wenyingzhuangia sp. chi5]MDO3695327.1 LamG-like jellyroll fold domain-containing protein [Wenyingzhuangia sp. chi5]